jgi:hypothetical protein
MSCETSQIKYTGNGSTTTYTFPFTYYVSTDVYVQLYNFTTHVWDTTTDWTFQNATTIQFNTAPPAPPSTEVKPNIKIGRNTDVEPMPATFYPGSAIRAQDLNSNFEVLQLAVEESKCSDEITIDNITDVSVNSPTEGQYLVYDDTDNVWENQDPPVIGDGTIQIKSYGSNDSASSDFSVNQTNTEQIILPQISYSDLKNVPAETVTGVGDGLELVSNTVQVDLSTGRSGGAGLEFSSGDLQTSIASSSVLGSVKAGDGINIDASGKISATSNASTTYRGSANLTTSATGQLNPATPEVKDLYINTTSGTIDASWVGIGGQSTITGDMVVWSGTSWDLIPTGASGSTTLQSITDAGNFTTNDINIGGTEGNPNIALDSSGSATFAGNIQANNPRNSTAGNNTGGLCINPSDTTIYYNFRVDEVDNDLRIDTSQGADQIKFGPDGSATIAGNVIIGPNQSGSISNNQDGVQLKDYGFGLFLHDDTNNGAFITCSQTGETSDLFSVLGDGSALFAGNVRVNSPSNVGSVDLLRLGNANNSGSASAHLFLANGYFVSPSGTDGTGSAASILDDGSATFAGPTQVGNNPSDGAGVGARISNNGPIDVARPNNENELWRGFQVGTTTPTSFITAGGSATFGSVNTASATGYGVQLDVATNSGTVNAQCVGDASQFTQLYGGYFGSNLMFGVYANGTATFENTVTAGNTASGTSGLFAISGSASNSAASILARNYNASGYLFTGYDSTGASNVTIKAVLGGM